MTWVDTFSRIGLCLVLVFPIGLEREIAHKTAGLRTHLLVGLGCCLFMLVSLQVASQGDRQWDPGRIAAQIVTGVGFLGGGAILRAGGIVRGMTTAASIWSVSAIGMAVGSGYYAGAVAGSLATYIVLSALMRWERRALRRRVRTRLQIRARGDEAVARCREKLESVATQSEKIRVEEMDGERILTVTGLFSPDVVAEIYGEMARDPEVLGVERTVL